MAKRKPTYELKFHSSTGNNWVYEGDTRLEPADIVPILNKQEQHIAELKARLLKAERVISELVMQVEELKRK